MEENEITIYRDLVQGTDEWIALRIGLLTASETKKIITPATLKYASNDKERAYVYEIAAQRINNYIEPSYVDDNMLRGSLDESTARDLYSKHISPVEQVGFIINESLGFKFGYSPDGLVGDDGLIEIKSSKQSIHLQRIVGNKIPDEHIIQIQTGLFVSGRKWCDFLNICCGMPMQLIRVYPDEKIQAAIKDCAIQFKNRVVETIAQYNELSKGFIPTERVIYSDDINI